MRYLTTLSVSKLNKIGWQYDSLIRGNLEGSGRGQVAIATFAWRVRRKLRKPQDSLCVSRRSNQAPPEYESGALSLDQPVQFSSVTVVFRTGYRDTELAQC